MITLRGRNVNTLFIDGLHELASGGVRQNTRAGLAWVMPCPVMSVYEKPCERVLFDTKRDANPFFHLMEGLWMLAGRDDPEFLNHYIKDFGSRFADAHGHDNSAVIHGAYGRRWRSALGYDQLDVIIEKLRANPDDRQCVLQIWDGVESFSHEDKTLGFNDLRGTWKDRPCNTQVYFRVRNITADTDPPYPVLDMTILCRSNDIVWGAYGANAVHFSMMMEYMAGRIGVGVGTMYQFSNNYHGYVTELDKLGDPADLSYDDKYEAAAVAPLPMGEDWSSWDDDLRKFMAWHEAVWASPSPVSCLLPRGGFKNKWFDDVACPAAMTNWLRRNDRMQEALVVVDRIEADDWHQACRAWLIRLADKKELIK